MELDSLKQKVLEMLPLSSLEQHDKTILKILVPTMKEEAVQTLYKAFVDEVQKLTQLEEKKKRLEMKYQIMSGKVSGGGPNTGPKLQA
ncbi:MAG: hypothetical protein AAB373_05240 [Patescibacteria group bacterium]